MSDENSNRTILDKLFDCVNSSIMWSTEQLKSACPPRQRKSKSVILQEEGENKSSSPESSKSFSPESDKSFSPESNKSEPCPDSSCPKKSYTQPSQICPKREACCFIKMQDPCAPCCCETKPKPPPCPPKCYPQEPRESVCGCERCQKQHADGKCCDQNRIFHGSSADPRYFEKA